MKKIKKKNISKVSLVISILFVLLLIIASYIRTERIPSISSDPTISSKTEAPITKSTTGSGLSYLIIHVSEDLHLKVTAPDGSMVSEEKNTMGDIVYGLIEPFTSYLEPDGPSMSSTREFEQKHPQKGVYLIELIPESYVTEKMWIMSLDKNGDDFLYKEELGIDSNGVVLKLNNDPENFENTSIKILR